jgi:hypothetical protein
VRAASAAFANLIAGSHQMSSRVDVMFDRQVIAEGVPVVAGQIDYDRTAARLARCTVTIADPLRVPVSATDILAPFGYELLVWRGVQPTSLSAELLTTTGGAPLATSDGYMLTTGALPGLQPELVPLGVFPIQASSVDGVTLVSTLSGEDRSRLVSDARFEDDYQIAAGTNYATAIQTLISAGVSGLEYLFPSVTFTTPLLTFAAQEDRWDRAQQMAKSIGHELLFDGLGRCVMRPEPTFSSTPVAAIAEGVNMTGAAVSLTRDGAYNRVIAASQNASTGDQFRGVATDNNPASPTYYFGPFGRKPRFFYSEFIASNAQAEAAAAAILAQNIGVARSVDFSAVPDPRLECSDVVQITRSALGIDDLHIIDQLTIGLGADAPMSGQSRTQQVTS